MVLFLLVLLVVMVAVALVIYILEEVGCRQADNLNRRQERRRVAEAGRRLADNLNRKPKRGRRRQPKAEPYSGEAGGDGWSALQDAGFARDSEHLGEVIDMFEAKARLERKKRERRCDKWQPANKECGPYADVRRKDSSVVSPKPGSDDD